MKLKKLEVKAFGGINPNSPVVIDFTDSKFVTAKGDNQVGKTSLLNALLVACGALSHTGKEGKNFINLDSDKIDINLDFIGKDRYAYNVRCTKSRFELTYEGEAIPEPITKMKELLGVVGISPMDIKTARASEIIKWLSSYTNVDVEDLEKKIFKFRTGAKEAAAARAQANRELKALNIFLAGEPMFNDWEGSEKKYVKAVDVNELSKQLKAAGDRSDKYILAEAKVTAHIERRQKIQAQIAELENELVMVEDNIKVGLDWIEKNKSSKTEYDTIKKQYDTAAADVVNFNRWQEIKRKAGERDEFETLSQSADAKEKDFLAKITALQTDILPDIKGVELVTEDTHEEGKVVKEGLYWNGKNSAQLSESEWWTLVMEIWKKYKVRVVVIDNMQSLGSMAVDILNKLVKDGAYVLAAEMDRETKSLTINYE